MINKRNEELNKITKESLTMALKDLYNRQKKPSISDICQKAGVSRNAYYRNFESLDDLVIYTLSSGWDKYFKAAKTNSSTSSINVTECLLRYVYEEREFIRNLKKHHQTYLIEEDLRRVFIPKQLSNDERYISYVIAYAVYGFIRAIIDNDFSETPDEIIARGKELEKNRDISTNSLLSKIVN